MSETAQKSNIIKTVAFEVLRYNPGQDRKPHLQQY